MDKHTAQCVKIVEQLLQEVTPAQTDVKDMMLWQRGYLTGLLASLIRDDSLTRRQITKRIKQYQNGT